MLRSAITLLRIPSTGVNYFNASSLQSCLLPSSTLALKYLHTTSNMRKDEERTTKLKLLSKEDDGTEGEKNIGIDNMTSKEDMFPDENTANRLFNGVPFKEIPVVNIRVTPNNTIITVCDHKGLLKILHSCGAEGFKNARKGTNIAAQATAISLSAKALEAGFKQVRVRVRGLGPGRMSAIKGLEMGGMNIVSITDNTRVTWFPLRPRKARRI